MPRGYLLFFVAVLGAIILALGLGRSLEPNEPHFSGDQGYQGQAASYRAGGTKCEPAKIRSVAAPLRQAQTDSCAQSAEQHRQTENALIESRRSAIATEASAYFDFVQARIAAYGASIGFMTLCAAVAAAIFAERAAFHTKSGTSAYKARESGQMLPGIILTLTAVRAIVKNVGPTRAVVLISKSALFKKPPRMIPFEFPGHVRASIAVEGGDPMDFGEFDLPPGPGTVHLIGAIIYRTVFNEVKLMPAGFKIDLDNMSWSIVNPDDFDWELWEQEMESVRRKQIN